MAYVISSACVDVKHKSCAAECPVDCIYEGDRTMYINPEECVDCGACKLLCEVGAIYYEGDLPESEKKFQADNAAFFKEILPGREAPIGTPGSASDFGATGVDTPMVAALPHNAG
ncbi:MAG: ferredoxin family protein [Mycobacterium sp.]|nr:ferredoxin family protein [Mycobacterium sp.]